MSDAPDDGQPTRWYVPYLATLALAALAALLVLVLLWPYRDEIRALLLGPA